MGRIEFMERLEYLLQDLPWEERSEALQYYNDYFDDAGKEDEERIIRELGSPEKLAMEVKAGIDMNGSDNAEYRETGYTDTRFEEKGEIEHYTAETQHKNTSEYTYADISQEEKEENKTRTNKTVKYILVGGLALFGLPIVVPLAIGLLAAVFGVLIAILAVMFAGVVILGTLVVVGVALVIAGISMIISRSLAGLAVIGIGLMVGVIGVVSVVGVGYMMIRFLPKLFRKVADFGKKISRRKEAS